MGAGANVVGYSLLPVLLEVEVLATVAGAAVLAKCTLALGGAWGGTSGR